MKITKEEETQIREFSKQIKTQNTCATEPLVFFEIQDVEPFACNPEYDSPDFYYYSSDDHGADEPYKGGDIEDIKEQIIQDAKDSEDPELIKEAEELELDYYDSELVPFCNRYVTKGIFFTRKGAEEHLEANHYHYSDKVRVYETPSWRNPEAKLVYKILTSLN